MHWRSLHNISYKKLWNGSNQIKYFLWMCAAMKLQRFIPFQSIGSHEIFLFLTAFPFKSFNNSTTHDLKWKKKQNETKKTFSQHDIFLCTSFATEHLIWVHRLKYWFTRCSTFDNNRMRGISDGFLIYKYDSPYRVKWFGIDFHGSQNRYHQRPYKERGA